MRIFGASKTPSKFALERAALIRSISFGSPEMVTIAVELTTDVVRGDLKSDADIEAIEAALLDCDLSTRQVIGNGLRLGLDGERQLGLGKRLGWERWTVMIDRLSVTP